MKKILLLLRRIFLLIHISHRRHNRIANELCICLLPLCIRMYAVGNKPLRVLANQTVPIDDGDAWIRLGDM